MSREILHPEIDRRHELHEALERAEQVVLEVGPGSQPYLDGPYGSQPRDSVYIGWNIDPRQHKLLVDTYEGPSRFAVLAKPPDHEGPEPTIDEFIQPDSIDTIIFANILGERDTSRHFKKESRLNPSGDDYRGATPLQSRLASLEAAVSFLKPLGTITVIETMTPTHDFPDREIRPEALRFLQSHGLEVVASLEARKPDDVERLVAELHDYGKEPSTSDKRSYLVRAQKPKNEYQ